MPTRPDVEPPSPGAVEKARILLERALGPSKVMTEPASCERFGADDSEAALCIPDAVVLAETKDDILAALRVAREAEVPNKQWPRARRREQREHDQGMS